MNAPRLDGPEWGLLIDRMKPVTFSFDGRPSAGYAGDVVASALFAEGRALLSRSFKYHRPRGVLTMAGHDANTIVEAGGEPNARADRCPLTDGLAVRSLNWAGSLDRDLYAALGSISRFLPVGFYYKTFFRPAGAWKYWERPIRAMAGLGRLDPEAHHGYYDKAYLFADVLVVGGGPAGLETAIAAAQAGAETLLIDEWPELGGSLLFGRGLDRKATNEKRAALVAEARSIANLTIMTNTTVSGLFADNWSSAIGGNRLYKIRSKETVLATGAFDQPLVFRDNDRPGIMFADAAQRLMRLYGVKPGRRAVVATANRMGYEAALDLADAGVEVAAVVDLNPAADGPAVEESRARGIRVISGSTLVETKGGKRVEAVAVAGIVSEGRTGASKEWIDADLVLMSVGYTPALNLACHAGAEAIYDPSIHMHRATDLPRGVSLVGSAAGLWSQEAVARHARDVGVTAATRALDLIDATASSLADSRHTHSGGTPSPRLRGEGGGEGRLTAQRPASAPHPDPLPAAQEGAAGRGSPSEFAVFIDPEAARITHAYPIFTHPRAMDLVDFDEDLSVKDIANTVKDGYDDIQLVKRYSTAGFGPSQGRHSNVNTIRIVANATGKTPQAIGTTTFRPPLVPEKFAHLAGRAFAPVRLTGAHHRHLELGAKMMVAGLWMRPAYYATSPLPNSPPQRGRERDRSPSYQVEAVEAEARAVREGVGLIDVSTLGGLDIRGPDAAAFVDRMYTGPHANQTIGRARYALMTDEAGVLIDDGVACRFHERHFYVTATTSGVDTVYRQMTWFNTRWKLDVDVANVTAAYSAVNLAGPRAREVVQTLDGTIDFSKDAFPYMAVRTGGLAGIPVRVLRVGFVGELGYEIHCPSGMGEALWDTLMAAGQPFGIRPFGVEAQRMLRLEKGHIIIGQDTDGLTHPAEAGLEWALAKKKPFHVGKRSIEMQTAKGLARKLVGFTLVDVSTPAPKECHLVIRDGAIAGRVTSAVRSPSLGRIVGLAYVPPDRASSGKRFEIRVDGGRMIEAEVVPTPFYDPENKRQEM